MKAPAIVWRGVGIECIADGTLNSGAAIVGVNGVAKANASG
ncbi:MAG: hypothetical protein R3C40_12200 [Parvularculaceae bacterium]